MYALKPNVSFNGLCQDFGLQYCEVSLLWQCPGKHHVSAYHNHHAGIWILLLQGVGVGCWCSPCPRLPVAPALLCWPLASCQSVSQSKGDFFLPQIELHLNRSAIFRSCWISVFFLHSLSSLLTVVLSISSAYPQTPKVGPTNSCSSECLSTRYWVVCRLRYTRVWICSCGGSKVFERCSGKAVKASWTSWCWYPPGDSCHIFMLFQSPPLWSVELLHLCESGRGIFITQTGKYPSAKAGAVLCRKTQLKLEGVCWKWTPCLDMCLVSSSLCCGPFEQGSAWYFFWTLQNLISSWHTSPPPTCFCPKYYGFGFFPPVPF